MEKKPIFYQWILVGVSIALFAIKVLAWVLTHSVAILTDALESTVNVVAGFIGLYSLYLSAKPKDKEHPYGHGKVEFITSAIEGSLIGTAGLIIIYEAINNLLHPHELKRLDEGIVLILITGAINYFVGYLCKRKGRLQNSPVLIAGGAHLQTDTYSTLGLAVGLALVYFTHINKLDSIVALLFALVVIFTAYKIIRRSLSGIMDEADEELIVQIVGVLNEHRQEDWVDVHNFRVIDYAGFYHIDCHLTVPYYLNLHEAHQVLDRLTDTLKNHFQHRVEFFVHVDGCLPFQCGICNLKDCTKRSAPFQQSVIWTVENTLSNEKHSVRQIIA